IILVSDLCQPAASIPQIMRSLCRTGGTQATALAVVLIIDLCSVRFGNGDQLTCGIIVQCTLTRRRCLIDQTTTQIIGPRPCRRRTLRLDQLARIVVAILGGPFWTIQLHDPSALIASGARDG